MTQTIIEQADGSYLFESPLPFALQKGGELPALHLVYETYGQLSAQKENVIRILRKNPEHIYLNRIGVCEIESYLRIL